MTAKLRLLGAAFLAALALPRGQAAAQEKDFIFYGVSFEQFEFREGIDDSGEVLAWDGDAFIGNDEWKLRLVSEGEYERDEEAFEVLEHQLVVQRLATDFFDVKAGVRYDAPVGPNRFFGVVGLHGLAQQWFEIDADFFLSDHPSFRFEAEYEGLITNRIILVPSIELDLPFTDDPALDVAAFGPKLEVGLRLSYDLVGRAISPYIGVHYERVFGETARIARGNGEDPGAVFFVAGARTMY